jgi:hypothetical protein
MPQNQCTEWSILNTLCADGGNPKSALNCGRAIFSAILSSIESSVGKTKICGASRIRMCCFREFCKSEHF